MSYNTTKLTLQLCYSYTNKVVIFGAITVTQSTIIHNIIVSVF